MAHQVRVWLRHYFPLIFYTSNHLHLSCTLEFLFCRALGKIVAVQLSMYAIFFLGWCLRKWRRHDTRGLEMKELAELAILYVALLALLLYLNVAIKWS